MKVHDPVVSGIFYPAEANSLRPLVEGYLRNVTRRDPCPKALIAPHAGYIYSGPVAASAYAPFRSSAAAVVSRVILAGPAHFDSFHGIALPDADTFKTPLGSVEIDRPGAEVALGFESVEIRQRAYLREHGLEVHLPFLQTVLGAFTLVPLLVGEAPTQLVTEVFEALWDDPSTLLVVSSDLSHYHDYQSATLLDRSTARWIESLQPERIELQHACGAIPVRGLLRCGRKRGMRVTVADLRNSGDTAGPKDRVVGYGAFLLYD